MKPYIEHWTESADHSFAIKRVIRERRDNFSTMGVWHYHSGFEITLTTVSSGQRFVGYNSEPYAPTDLVLIGENTPHCWITDEHTEQTVINFERNFLGEGVWDKSELSEVQQMLNRSKRGIAFSKEVAEKARKRIRRIEKSQKFERLMHFLSLLGYLAHEKDYRYLSSYDEESQGNLKMSNRMEHVYAYVLSNFKNPDVSQAALAEELNMTSSSFCKFVKNMTRKTFYDLILEARVSHAGRLLVNSDKYVSEICFASGFNNVSNFNRIFKRIMKKSPQQYRKTYS